MNQALFQLSPDSDKRLVLDSTTNLELIASLKAFSNASWPIFVQKYTRLLERWCDEWRATPEDAEDVVQETLLELFRRINDYKANPESTFRSWLKKVAYYRYLRILKKSRTTFSSNNSDSFRPGQNKTAIASEPSHDSFLKIIDMIADQELLEIACLRIARRIPSEKWAIFCQRELDGLPGKTVAEEFGISTNAVDVITYRVRKMIRAELEMLDPKK